MPSSDHDVLIGFDILKKGRISVNYGTGQVAVNAISKNEDNEVYELVKKYQDVLVERLDKDVGKAKVPEMKIHVDPSKPPAYLRNYRTTLEEKEALELEVAKMLKAGVIEPTSEDAVKKRWNSPVILVRKKNGEYRFCVDFRKLNEATYKLNRPLPRYWQIPVAEESRPYLAFESNRSQYQFKVMPFGITKAPVIFQTIIERVMGDIPGVSADIDDVVVYTETKEEHLKTLEKVLERMRGFNRKANVTKCEFGKKEIEIFGFFSRKWKREAESQQSRSDQEAEQTAHTERITTLSWNSQLLPQFCAEIRGE